jgi:hypothetical protein
MLSSLSSQMKCGLQHTRMSHGIILHLAIVRESGGCIGLKLRICRAGNTSAVERDALLNKWSDNDTNNDHASTDANQRSD